MEQREVPFSRIVEETRAQVQDHPDEENKFRCHAAKHLDSGVRRLQSLDKEDIRLQLFKDTPSGMYEMMWSFVESSNERLAETTRRQMERLRGLHAEMPSEEDLLNDAVDSPPNDGPDSFAPPLQRLPKGFTIATKHAEVVLLDRMYVALEAHYDELLRNEYLKEDRDAIDLEHQENQRKPSPHKRRVQSKVLEFVFQ